MRHEPVLLQEVIETLNLSAGKNVVDCTLGDGGHSEAILKATAPDGKLLGLDADAESLLRAKNFLASFGDRATFVRTNFEALEETVVVEQFGPVHGILMDLGWSSPQFAERNRGFSFLGDNEPLDMRYDANNTVQETAAHILNTRSVEELSDIFYRYGEEKQSERIARAIVATRKQKPYETVKDATDTVNTVYRELLGSTQDVPWLGGNHPATQVFQALRIAVNDELGVVERTIPQALQVLAPGGRLVVITFHSLEDRIVKHLFKEYEKKEFTIITKKPIIATDAEIEKNVRARSAKVRVIEKTV